MSIIKVINGENFLVPADINLNPHKHREEEKWVSLWFYKNRRKTLVYPEQINVDKVITSKLQYQKNIFYKMSSMSEEDVYFDYFFRLKDKKGKNLIKKNNRFKKSNPHQKKKKKDDYKSKSHKIDEDGKYIVTFS